MTADNIFPSPLGRRWRAAPDEGEVAHDSCRGKPQHPSLIRLQHLLPEGEGKKRQSQRSKLYEKHSHS